MNKKYLKSRFIILRIVTFCIIILNFFSCSPLDKTSRQIYRETRRDNKNVLYKASEINDSSHTLIIFFDNNHFECLMGPINPKNRYQKYYAGLYSEKEDTILLTYYKNYIPTNMSETLIKDSSGKYLIYPFKDFQKKMYLEIKKDAYQKKD